MNNKTFSAFDFLSNENHFKSKLSQSLRVSLKTSSEPKYNIANLTKCQTPIKHNNKNLSVIKLIMFQSFFVFLNLHKNSGVDHKELNNFYQLYQYFFYYLMTIYQFTFVNICQKNKEHKQDPEKEMFILYNYIWNYILKNKHRYNTEEDEKNNSL